MMRLLMCSAGLLALAACAPSVPDSAAGVGFGSYDEYQQQQADRDAALTGAPQVDVQPLDADAQAREQARLANSGEVPLEASPNNPAPEIVNEVGISGENDFDAVSAERSIESDAERLARNRSQYQLIEPTSLPTRPGTDRPNIVEYALRTTNPVGTPLYRRLGLNAKNRSIRNCAKYTSADLAQEAFLEMGGPEKDRKGLDPDGDGFACLWDPAPFRLAKSN